MKKMLSKKSKGESTSQELVLNKKSLAKRIMAHWQLYILMLPALVFIILFRYKPMYGIIIAFKDFSLKKGIMGSPWVGFDNFERLFKTYTFPIALRNTLVISFTSMIVNFPLPIIVALAVNEIKNTKAKKLIQTVSYAPHFISTVVMCGMVILFLSPSQGMINHFIEFLGGERISFMQESHLFKWVFALSGAWQGAGWGAIIYFSALAAVDKTHLEAAEIDGASRFQQVLYINLPTIVPVIAIQLILRCGSLVSVGYEKALLLQNSANISASEVLSTYVYKMGLQNFDYSFSTAANIFNSICNIIILLVVNKISAKVTETSLF